MFSYKISSKLHSHEFIQLNYLCVYYTILCAYMCVFVILFVSLKHLVYMHPFIYSFVRSFIFFIFIFLLLYCLFSYICYIISFHDCNTYILPSRCVNLHTSFIYIFCCSWYSFVVGGTTHNHY